MATLTPDHILTLAPDASSAKNAHGLATPGKWPALHATERALWGECQGSGQHPYLVGVDRQDPSASKCSCPSRKFPCKHALALLLLHATHPGAFGTDAPPEALSAWLAGRTERASKSAEQAPTAPKPVSPAALDKRRAARDAKVTAGLADLSMYLRDLIAGGLAAAQQRPYREWDAQAARLIDAQAPGAARQLRATPAHLSDADALLTHLARLHLLCTAWAARATLTPEEEQEVRSAVGFPLDTEAVLAQPGVTADWAVLGQVTVEEEQLTVRRTWLRDVERDQDALLLDFAPPGRPLPAGLVARTTVHATVHYPHTALPQRALLGDDVSPPAPARAHWPERGLEDLLDRHAAHLARNPWLERSAHHVTRARLAPGTPWLMLDEGGQALPLAGAEQALFRLHALGGGRPVTLSGEWDGQAFTPLALLEVHGE